MTQLESRLMNLAATALRKYISDEPNWEQRRYEIAKDYATRMFATPAFRLTNQSMAEVIRQSVIFADTLISELKKQKEG